MLIHQNFGSLIKAGFVLRGFHYAKLITSFKWVLKRTSKQTLTTHGSTLSIRRTPANVVEVYDTEPIYQASKPFRLEHIVQLTSPFDSVLIVGDIADDVLGEDTYLIVHSDAEIVNREIMYPKTLSVIKQIAILISREKLNLVLPTIPVVWTDIKTDLPCVVDDTAYAAKQ